MSVEWLQPAALLALGAIAGPVAVHLLRRQRATRVPFPSLRFVDSSHAAALRMRFPSDIWLLLIRVAIIAAAAIAWAQPALMSPRRSGPGQTVVARAIVTDLSASMKPVAAAVGEAAAAERAGADVVLDVPAADVRLGLRDARAALEEARAERRELVVISDFQIGTLDESDLAAIPSAVAVRFVPIARKGPGAVVLPEPPAVLTHAGVDATTQTIAIEGPATRVTLRRATRSGAEPRYVTAAGQEAGLDRLRRSLAAANTPALAGGRAVAVVFPGAAPGAQTSEPREPWMREAIVRMRLDPALRAAFDGLTATEDHRDGGAVPVLMDKKSRPFVAAAASGAELVIRSSVEPSEYAAAATVHALLRALAPRLLPTEYEVESIPSATLQRWTRTAPAEPPRPRPEPPGDARVLWAVVLALLALETFVRRRPAMSGNEDLRRAA
jgi:Aerotolerance regulator N-terminal